MRHGYERSGPLGDAAKNAEQRGAQDAQQNAAIHLADHKNDGQQNSEASSLHLAIGKIADAQKSSWIGHHQLGLAHADEANEHADAGSGGMLKAIGNAVHDLL